MSWILWILLLKINGTLAISTIEISPALTQTTWAGNYVGPLYTVRFSPSTSAISFVWSISDTFNIFNFAFLSLSSNDCSASGTASSGGFSAFCDGTKTTLSATQGILIPYMVTLTAILDGTAITSTLQTEINPTSCSLEQPFSTVISTNPGVTGACDYNCTINYQCIPGYSTVLGGVYTSRCNEFATVQPAEQCLLQALQTSSDGLPVWGIVIIALGGFAILAAGIFFLWKYCKRRPAAVSA